MALREAGQPKRPACSTQATRLFMFRDWVADPRKSPEGSKRLETNRIHYMPRSGRTLRNGNIKPRPELIGSRP